MLLLALAALVAAGTAEHAYWFSRVFTFAGSASEDPSLRSAGLMESFAGL